MVTSEEGRDSRLRCDGPSIVTPRSSGPTNSSCSGSVSQDERLKDTATACVGGGRRDSLVVNESLCSNRLCRFRAEKLASR